VQRIGIQWVQGEENAQCRLSGGEGIGAEVCQGQQSQDCPVTGQLLRGQFQ